MKVFQVRQSREHFQDCTDLQPHRGVPLINIAGWRQAAASNDAFKGLSRATLTTAPPEHAAQRSKPDPHLLSRQRESPHDCKKLLDSEVVIDTENVQQRQLPLVCDVFIPRDRPAPHGLPRNSTPVGQFKTSSVISPVYRESGSHDGGVKEPQTTLANLENAVADGGLVLQKIRQSLSDDRHLQMGRGQDTDE